MKKRCLYLQSLAGDIGVPCCMATSKCLRLHLKLSENSIKTLQRYSVYFFHLTSTATIWLKIGNLFILPSRNRALPYCCCCYFNSIQFVEIFQLFFLSSVIQEFECLSHKYSNYSSVSKTC